MKLNVRNPCQLLSRVPQHPPKKGGKARQPWKQCAYVVLRLQEHMQGLDAVQTARGRPVRCRIVAGQYPPATEEGEVDRGVVCSETRRSARLNA
jgi:hypothetical protein